MFLLRQLCEVNWRFVAATAATKWRQGSPGSHAACVPLVVFWAYCANRCDGFCAWRPFDLQSSVPGRVVREHSLAVPATATAPATITPLATLASMTRPPLGGVSTIGRITYIFGYTEGGLDGDSGTRILGNRVWVATWIVRTEWSVFLVNVANRAYGILNGCKGRCPQELCACGRRGLIGPEADTPVTSSWCVARRRMREFEASAVAGAGWSCRDQRGGAAAGLGESTESGPGVPNTPWFVPKGAGNEHGEREAQKRLFAAPGT